MKLPFIDCYIQVPFKAGLTVFNYNIIVLNK